MLTFGTALIDSHCHLPHNKVRALKWLTDAKLEGVEKFITIGTSIAESEQAVALAHEFNNVYATIGGYQNDDKNVALSVLNTQLQQLVSTSTKIVGVGECGIDISNWANGRSVTEQLELFDMQIKFALQNNLPLVIHNRNGDEPVITLLKKYKSDNLRGVAHCFASSWEAAQQFLDLGFYISFSGLITYPSRKELLEVVKNVPFDKFLVETDSPYLPPQEHRGERNEPKYVKMVAQKLANVKVLPVSEICRLSYENTCRLFGLN